MRDGQALERRQVLPLRSSTEERKARREGLVFYLTVLLVLAGMSAHALWTSPTLRSPLRLYAFSGLVLVHAFLHWRSPLLALRPDLALAYLVAQGALAAAIVSVARSPSLALAVFPVLIGVAAGTVPDRRLGVTAAVAYLALGLATLRALLGPRDFAFDGVMIAATALFAVVFALGYRRQVDAREEVQELLLKLTAAHEQLAQHALRIEDLTRAAERQRMARELHDTLAQGLAGLVLLIEAAADHLRDQRAGRAGAILEHALARARQTLAEARRAIDGLREPPTADALDALLRSEAERFHAASGIACHLTLEPLPAIDADAAPHVRRIVAEALGNVARHARASQVTLSAVEQDGQLELVVADDGVGFDVEREQARPGHYGLVGMQERARLAGAELCVEAAPGCGTRVRLRLARRQDAADA